VTGDNSELQRSSDNGEPSGTAGMPMLEAIRHSGCEKTAAAVVRYFGGVKLGAGGLIRAYSGSVANALANAPKTESVPMDIWRVTYPYDMSGTLENWLRRNTEIQDISYDAQVTCTFASELKDIPENIRNLSKGACEAVHVETVHIEKRV
jgi:putative IMPACT (imprinted ancient) family translation regulator